LRNNFEEIYKNYISYLNENVPEIGNTLTYWDDPLKSNKTRSILLPFAHNIDGNMLTFSMELWVFVLDKTPANITEKQISIMEKLYSAVYASDAEDGSIIDADYILPTPEMQNIGILRLDIKINVDYIDDCN